MYAYKTGSDPDDATPQVEELSARSSPAIVTPIMASCFGQPILTPQHLSASPELL